MANIIAEKITEFSKAQDKLEKLYRVWYFARAKWIRVTKNKPFPLESTFRDLEADTVSGRNWKIRLLQIMSTFGANPKDYGLSVYGLTKKQVQDAYPKLKTSGLGVAPLVIGGTILVALIAATAAAIAAANKYSQINLEGELAAEYEKQGLTKPQAVLKAAADIKEATAAASSGGLFDFGNILDSGLLKFVGLGILGYVFWSKKK